MKKLFIVILICLMVGAVGIKISDATTFDLTIQHVVDDSYRAIFYNATSRPIVIMTLSINFYNDSKWVTTRTSTFVSIAPGSKGTAILHLDGIKWNKYSWEIQTIR